MCPRASRKRKAASRWKSSVLAVRQQLRANPFMIRPGNACAARVERPALSTAKRIPAFCTQCRSRCGCVAVVEEGRLMGIEPMPDHPSGEKLCPKGQAAPELVYHKDRLTVPLRRTAPKGATDPGWQPIAWDEALDEIARRMRAMKTEHGPEQVAFSVTTPSGTHI